MRGDEQQAGEIGGQVQPAVVHEGGRPGAPRLAPGEGRLPVEQRRRQRPAGKRTGGGDQRRAAAEQQCHRPPGAARPDRPALRRQDRSARLAEHRPPQRQHGVALGGQAVGRHLRRLLVEARAVLHAAQLAVGVGGGAADARPAAGRRPRRAAAARCCRRCRAAPAASAACDSTRNCTANSASTMPPGLCLTSKRPAFTGCAARTLLAHGDDLAAQRRRRRAAR